MILVQMKQWVRLRSTKVRHVLRSVFSIATSRLRPPTLLTRTSMEPASAKDTLAETRAGLGLGYVGGKGPNLPPPLAHFIGGPCLCVRIAGVQHDVGARFRRRERNDPAEAAAATGDEQALVVQSEAVEHVHGRSLMQCLGIIILSDNN